MWEIPCSSFPLLMVHPVYCKQNTNSIEYWFHQKLPKTRLKLPEPINLAYDTFRSVPSALNNHHEKLLLHKLQTKQIASKIRNKVRKMFMVHAKVQ